MCENVPSERSSVIIFVTFWYIYFCVLWVETYGTEPIKLDMFQRCWFVRKGESERNWKELLVRTVVIRIPWGSFALSLEFPHHLICHFSCDMVISVVNKPDAHKSTSTALSIPIHLCQETPGLRDSKAHSLSGFCLLVCASSDGGRNLSLSLLPAATRVSSLPRGCDTGNETSSLCLISFSRSILECH